LCGGIGENVDLAESSTVKSAQCQQFLTYAESVREQAVGLAGWLGPREMWKILPGGMPYVEVNLDG
jgi:hypothetical protein